MTVQEVKEKYGDREGYVNCYKCPIHDLGCSLVAATGFEDCWKEIAKKLPEDFLSISTKSVNGTQPDMVNHPPHYETGKYDCIEVMVEAIGAESVKSFCLCNAFKYIYRCTKKHETPDEDVKKAVWYLNKFLEL